jgi:hypothetical protein
MSVNVIRTSESQELPFFARFLEEQAAEEPTEQPQETEQPTPLPCYTLKFPSDFEDGF